MGSIVVIARFRLDGFWAIAREFGFWRRTQRLGTDPAL
jgi:hypothetical protein